MILHVSDHTQITNAMTNSQSEIFYQLTSISGLPTSSAICEQTVMNFTNTTHGFCVDWSHLDESRGDFEISTWFGSISHFSEHENARFRDGRFSMWQIHSQTH